MPRLYFALLVFTCCATITKGANGQSNNIDDWVLIYENDAEGNPIHGNIDELIKAVRDGEDVKVYWSGQSVTDKKRKVEHVAVAKFLTVMSDQTVLAQIDPIIGQIPDFDKQQIVLKENLEWSMIVSTNGKSDQMTRNVITGEIDGEHQIRKRAVKWFVRK